MTVYAPSQTIPSSDYPEAAPTAAVAQADPLLRMLFSFWEAKVLMCAVRLRIFDVLADGPADSSTIVAETDLHDRAARNFLDCLVALKLLAREDGMYSSTPLAKLHLDRRQPGYLGGLVEFADARLYPVWGKLEEALKSGTPQNEASQVPEYYSNLMRDEDRLRMFVEGMRGLSMDVSAFLSTAIDWSRYSILVDIGGAHGFLAGCLVSAHPHLHGITFDLPALGLLFEQHRKTLDLNHHLSFKAGDFFKDPLPDADVMILGHVLHNWSIEQKEFLIAQTHHALRPGGVLLIYDAMIDDDSSANSFALLMSLNMLLVTSAGATYTVSECAAWLDKAGFRAIRSERCSASTTLVVATK